MKKSKVIVTFLIVLLACCLCIILVACNNYNNNNNSNKENGELEYRLNSDDVSYSVTGKGTITTNDIVIPNIYQGKPVTNIDTSAFYECDKITSITIPNSVTSIGDNLVVGCYKLQYNDYNGGLYIGNKQNPYLALVKAKSSTIEYFNINIIAKLILSEAFKDCDKLLSITIPNSVTNIGNRAFF